MPTFEIFDPTYAISTVVFGVMDRCTATFHCCTYPDPRSLSTANTPCPRPAVGVWPGGATFGPLCRTKTGVIESRARCDTVCKKGNVGVVNGVVMPAISIQTKP